MSRQHDAHLVPWLKSKFDLKLEYTDSFEYVAYRGDYDYDTPCAFDKAVFHCAVEYGNFYDGAMFDKLVEIEMGQA